MKKAKFGKVIFTLMSSALILAVTPTVQYAATSMGNYLNITSNNSIEDVLGAEAGIYQTAINCYMTNTKTLDSTIANSRTYYGVGETVNIRFSFSREIRSSQGLELGIKFGNGTEIPVTACGVDNSYLTFNYTIESSDNGGLTITYIKGNVTDANGYTVQLGILGEEQTWTNTIIAKGTPAGYTASSNDTTTNIQFKEPTYKLENNQIRPIKKTDIKYIDLNSGKTGSFNNSTGPLSVSQTAVSYGNSNYIIYIEDACDIAGNTFSPSSVDRHEIWAIDGGWDNGTYKNKGNKVDGKYYYKEGTQITFIGLSCLGDKGAFKIGEKGMEAGSQKPVLIADNLYRFVYTIQAGDNGEIKPICNLLTNDYYKKGERYIADTTAPTITWNYMDLIGTGTNGAETSDKKGWVTKGLAYQEGSTLTVPGNYAENTPGIKKDSTGNTMLYLKDGRPKGLFTVTDNFVTNFIVDPDDELTPTAYGEVNGQLTGQLEGKHGDEIVWLLDANSIFYNYKLNELKTDNGKDTIAMDHIIYVTDYAGNVTRTNSWIDGKLKMVADWENPKVTITNDANNQTKKDEITFTIESSDPSGNYNNEKFDGSGINGTVDPSKVIVENGTIISSTTDTTNHITTVKVMPAVDGYVSVYVPEGAVYDNCDNPNDASNVTKVLVDRTAPVINDVTGNPTDWAKDATLSVIASDAGSGEIQYSFNGGAYSTTNTYKVTENGNVKIKVKDAVGNESEVKTVSVTKIDKTVPTISGTEQKQVSRYATELTIKAEDKESGLAEYSFDGGKSWQTSPTKTYTETTTIAANQLQVKDRVGNITKYNTPVTVAIKGATPIIKVENDGGNYVVPTDGNAAKVKTTIEVDAENETTIYYAVSSNNTTAPTNYQNVEANKAELSIDMTAGTWYLWVYAIDNTLNLESEKYISNAFVVKNSEITLTANPSGWTNQDVKVDISYGDGLTENRFAGIGDNREANLNTITVSENGTVYAEATDIAGNKVYSTLEINTIDKIAPEVEIDVQTQEYVLGPTDESVNMNNRITVKEENLSSVEYTWTKENKEPTTWENSFTAEQLSAKVADVTKTVTNKDNGIWYLYAKATDLAGNSTITKTGELVVKAAISFDTTTKGTSIKEVKTIDGVSYVIVAPGTTATNLLKYVSSPYTVAVKTSDSKKTVSGNSALVTNEIITVNNTDAKCIIVVKGDVHADGNINLSDILKLNKARLNKITLTKAEMLAGNVVADATENTINLSDIIKLNQYRLGKIANL